MPETCCGIDLYEGRSVIANSLRTASKHVDQKALRRRNTCYIGGENIDRIQYDNERSERRIREPFSLFILKGD